MGHNCKAEPQGCHYTYDRDIDGYIYIYAYVFYNNNYNNNNLLWKKAMYSPFWISLLVFL